MTFYRLTMKVTNLKKYLPAAFGGVALFFIVKLAFALFPQLQSSILSISPQAIIFSALFYLGYFYLRALSWHLILGSLKQPALIKDSLETWFVGELARFIPGNIWSFAGRVYLGHKKKLPKTAVVISLTVEVLVMLSATFVLSLPA